MFYDHIKLALLFLYRATETFSCHFCKRFETGVTKETSLILRKMRPKYNTKISVSDWWKCRELRNLVDRLGVVSTFQGLTCQRTSQLKFIWTQTLWKHTSALHPIQKSCCTFARYNSLNNIIVRDFFFFQFSSFGASWRLKNYNSLGFSRARDEYR